MKHSTRAFGIALIVCGSALSLAARSMNPHYVFLIPNGYVGWVQVIFNDPQAPALLIENGGVVVDVPESGIIRTSNLRVHASVAPDEFYYRVSTLSGTIKLHRVPADYFLPGSEHGGFGVMDTSGRGPGYSWFIFIGPPESRRNVPFADWNKFVEDYRRSHGDKARVEFAGTYPTPGRMENGTGTRISAPTPQTPH